MAQHDTSLHLWSPFAEQKWYLITTLDDHSRRMLYGDLWEKETSWAHIVALKAVVMQFGCPLKYYVDNHAIFRFIERRDTFRQKANKKEAEALVQWKEVLKDLGIEPVYALSPAAKGKLKDRIDGYRIIWYEHVHARKSLKLKRREKYFMKNFTNIIINECTQRQKKFPTCVITMR